MTTRAPFPIRVWAPAAQHVDLVLPAATEPPAAPSSIKMTKAAGGWWEGPELPPGTDYWFSLDGGDPLPDPRSTCQPQGVHGPSRVWAPPPAEDRAESPDIDPLGAVFYELHVGTFSEEGTLDGAIPHLDHLVRLGVDVVELMPLAAFAGEFGWGYDGVDLFAVHAAYGGPDALVRFVDAAHERGLAVCLDVVLNHLGPWGNYLGQFGPYYTDRHRTPWGPGFNLDSADAAESHEPREFLLDVCRHWLVDLHVDCLRLDAIHAIHDDSPVHLLAELSTRVARWSADTGRRMALVAESDLNDVRVITPVADGGLGMDAQWADDVHHALHTAFTGESQGYYGDFAQPGVLAHVLEDVFLHAGTFSTFRDRIWGKPVPADMDRRRFVVFDEDHDQVGNRAAGDRPSTSLTAAQQAASAALVLLSPFTPMLFMGQEWGTRQPFAYFSDQEDEHRAELVRQGRASEFGSHGWSESDGIPDPTARSTVVASTLDWSEAADGTHARLLDWHRELIELRRSAGLGSAGPRATSTQTDDTVVMETQGFRVEASLRAGVPLGDSLIDEGDCVLSWSEPEGDYVRVIRL